MTDSDIQRAEYDMRWHSDEGGYGRPPRYAPGLIAFMDRWLGQSTTSSPRIADVGCGRGFFSEHLDRLGGDVTGLDLSPEAVRMARERVPGASFAVHDITTGLPFEDNEIEVVWCSEVLEHLFSPLDLLREIRRVLRPGGLLLTTVPAHTRFKNVVIALARFESHYDPTYPHIRFFTKRSFVALLRQAGFSPEETSTCGVTQHPLRDRLWPTNLLVASR